MRKSSVRKTVMIAAVTVALAAAVSACGRKGPLEQPGGAFHQGTTFTQTAPTPL